MANRMVAVAPSLYGQFQMHRVLAAIEAYQREYARSPSIRALAALTGMGYGTVRPRLRQLEKCGFIKTRLVCGSRGAAIYEVVPL